MVLVESDWDSISCDQTKTEKFYIENRDRIDIDLVLMTHRVSEKFIRSVMDLFNEDTWRFVFSKQKLSMRFLNEFKHKMIDYDYGMISKTLRLDSNFIEMNADRLSWDHISIYQILNKDLRKKFEDRITFDRPNLIYSRDIKPHGPNMDFIMKYSAPQGNEITWNAFLKQTRNIDHVKWVSILVKRNKRRNENGQ